MKKIIVILLVLMLGANMLVMFAGNMCGKADDARQGGPYYHQIYSATSTNGINWVTNNTMVFDHASVPGTVYFNNKLYLYYVNAADPENEKLSVGVSTDKGVTFTVHDVNITGTNSPYPVDPNPIVDGNKIRLTYLGNFMQGGTNKIVTATSSDGTNFTEDGVIFTENVFDPDLFYYNVSSQWVLFVSNGTNLTKATSSFPTGTFTKDPSFSWNAGGISSTHKIGSKYYTYYAGMNGISVAEYSNGVLSNIADGIVAFPNMTADPTVAVFGPNDYKMFVKTTVGGGTSEEQITVNFTGSTYKNVTEKPSGWFTSGQNADIMLSGIDFNNTGGPLLFNHPTGIVSDGTHLLLSDTWNNRVLIWNSLPTGNVMPNIVLGQENFYSNNPGRGLNQMNWPMGVSTDGQHVVVADTNNDRILIWNTFPTYSGQPANLVIEGDPTATYPTRRIDWPWGIWTNGVKLVVSSTSTASVLIWNTFPTQNNQSADIYLTGQGQIGTPRNIVSDGLHLIVGDHNANVPGATSHNGNFFWSSFPTTNDQMPTFFMADAGCPGGAWMRGEFTQDHKLVLLGVGLYIWNTFPANNATPPNLTVGQWCPGGTKYWFHPAEGAGLTLAGSRLYTTSNNVIIGFNSLPTTEDAYPDFAVGGPDVYTNTLETNYIIQNPVPATDGTSLFVSSDSQKLYVWKYLPDESSAKPDIVYTLPFAPWDSALFNNTLVLAGKDSVYIWDELPLDGELPDERFKGSIGNVTFQELKGVELDDQYFYLSDRDANKIYIWEGIPNQTTNPKFSLDIQVPTGLSSDGTYLVVAATEAASDERIKFYKIDELSSSAEGTLLGINVNLPQAALSANGHLFVADTCFNRVLVWSSISDAVDGKAPNIVLGEEDFNDTLAEIGMNKLFMPAALTFDGSYLWVGEFKFSGRIVRFSVKQIPHEPIYIDGNANFTSANGVIGGNGTEINPYIIEGWDINASSANGIEIRNTDKYFIIRNCEIHDGESNYNDGIYSYNVTNGKIDNVTLSNNRYGNHLYYSSNNSITSNQIHNNKWKGIWLYYSSNNSVISNQIHNNNDYGIDLWFSSNNSITSNQIHNNNDGISFYYPSNNNIISANQIYNNGYGIDLCISVESESPSNNNSIYHNNFINNTDNAYDNCSNFWDYNGEGNYWSDYDEPGEGAYDNNTDGIVDTPYAIPGGSNADNYPFIEENGWIPEEENQPPIADFTYSPLNLVVNEIIIFNATNSTDPDGYITNYEWNFDDGNITSTTEPTITHSYSLADDYVVDLTVTDDDGATNLTSEEVLVGTVESENFTLSEGWSYEGKLIDEPYLFDVTVVRLDDGRYRLYGEASDIGSHTVVSYISDDGLNFQKEAGYRLTGAFMPFVVKLPDEGFRLYYTDQTGEPAAPGARAIMSAISEDGLSFTIEDGDRLTYTGSGYESLGIRGAKILQLNNGSYRMYYHGIDGDNHWRVLSAVSEDGLNWTREEGVRLDPSNLCCYTTRIGNVAPFITPDGIYHLYVAALVGDGGDAIQGIFDTTSTDGLTFTVNSTPVITGYTTESNSVEPEDPAVIMTDNGLRMYFAPYGTQGSVIPESGIHSIINKTANTPPVAYIDSISPNPANQGETVTFTGHGDDSDGSIVAYNWRSSINGFLSSQASFSISTLSVGTHMIYFKVQDNNGTWSSEASEILTINPAGLTQHAPISINGNSQFTSANGVSSGDGTAGNPYIIENWDISASTAHGIHIENTDKYFIIRNCLIHDGYDSANYIYNYGILFYNVQNGEIENCEIYNNYYGIVHDYSSNTNISANQIHNNYWSGTYLGYSSNNNISANQIYNNSDGIYLPYSSNNNISSNQIYNNSVYGIYLVDSSNNNLSANQIYNNDYGICLVSSSNNTISANQIYNNYYSIYLSGYWSACEYNQICANNIHNNSGYWNSAGVYLYYSSNNEIHYNNIYNNTNYGVYNYNYETQYQANATYNWWGDASGPYHSTNLNGTGDNVNDNVIYEPWLIEPWSGAEDTDAPQITNIQAIPSSQVVNGYVNIICTVTDNIGINIVKVNITYPNGETKNITMTQVSSNSYSYNASYSVLGSYSYYIWTDDISGNQNKSATYTFSIRDSTNPIITSVQVVPASQSVGGYVNITCTVTDNVEVSMVRVNITGPAGFTPINTTMTKIAGTNNYYYNTNYSVIGNYSYYIWANDTSNNQNKSATYRFSIIAPGPTPTSITALVDGKEVNITCICTGTITITSAALPSLPPENLQYIGIQINITITGTLTYANIAIKYNESDVANIDETKLRMYYWDGSQWQLCVNTGVDTVNNIVWANVTHLTIFAPMAEKIVAPPVAVTLNSPTDITSTTMQLSWSQNTDSDFANYTIYQSTASGNMGTAIYTETTQSTTSCTVTGLSPSTTYYFTVRVYDTGGWCNDSNQVSGTTSAAATTGSLTGTVTDKNSKPIEGATVSIVGTNHVTWTDSNGRYTFTGVTASSYQVRAEKSGYKTKTETGVTINAGGTTTLNIVLEEEKKAEPKGFIPGFEAVAVIIALGVVMLLRRKSL